MKYLRDAGSFRLKVFSLMKKGIKQIEIARRLGVSRQRINQIVHPDKAKARGVISTLVQNGIIPRAAKLKCTDCGGKAKEYDHPDYEKPKEVQPVCEPCHTKRTKHWNSPDALMLKRNDKILAFAKLGWSHRTIAGKFAISRRRVSQIVNDN